MDLRRGAAGALPRARAPARAARAVHPRGGGHGGAVRPADHPPAGADRPADIRGWSIADAYGFGPSLWVAPVLEDGARVVHVDLPRGDWIDAVTPAPSIAGGGEIDAARAAGPHPGVGPARRADRHLSRSARRARAGRHAGARAPAGGHALGRARRRTRAGPPSRRHEVRYDRGEWSITPDRPVSVDVREPIPTVCSHRAALPRRILRPWPSPPPPRSGHRAPAPHAGCAWTSRTAPARRSTSPSTTRGSTELRVAVLRGQAKLEPWCAAHGVEEAIVGGFFVRPHGTPLGEVRTHGVAREHVPFTAPFDAVRACVHVDGGVAAHRSARRAPCARRAATCCRPGPLLVRDGRPSSAARRTARASAPRNGQFDSDITDGRYPRAALGLGDGPHVRGRRRRPLHDRRGPHARGARGADGRARRARRDEPRRRRLDVADQRRPAAQPPARGTRPPEPGGRPVSTALLFVPRSSRGQAL